MLAWNTLTPSRKALLLAAVAFFALTYWYSWPRGTNAPLRAHLSCIGQVLAIGGLLLNPAVVRWSGQQGFGRWPPICKWLFGVGFAVQIVALVLLAANV